MPEVLPADSGDVDPITVHVSGAGAALLYVTDRGVVHRLDTADGLFPHDAREVPIPSMNKRDAMILRGLVEHSLGWMRRF